MMIKQIVGTMVLAVFVTGAVCAQTKKATKFTSAYTSLGRGCKTLSGHGGTDDAFLCKGIGGYRVRIYYSASATHINAEIKEESFSIATLSIGFEESKARLEWRMANGKPFAVIMRVPRYGPVNDDNPYFGEAVGQELSIQGLKGFEDLSKSVGARTPGANAKAREIADQYYTASRPAN